MHLQSLKAVVNPNTHEGNPIKLREDRLDNEAPVSRDVVELSNNDMIIPQLLCGNFFSNLDATYGTNPTIYWVFPEP